MCSSVPAAPAADPKIGEYYTKMGELGEKQSDYMLNTYLPKYLQQQDASIATSKQLTDEQIEMSRSQRGMADMYRSRLEGKLFPMQDQMAAEAMSAGGVADQQLKAGQAKADVRQDFARQRMIEERRARSLGPSGNPASGSAAGNASRMGIAEALGTSAAGTRAREMAKELGWAKRSDVASSLQGMVGGQATAAQSAMSGFGSANQMAYSPLAAMNSGAGAFSGGMSAGASMYGGAGAGFQGLSNYGLQAWSGTNSANAASSAGTGQLIGVLGSAAIMA